MKLGKYERQVLRELRKGKVIDRDIGLGITDGDISHNIEGVEVTKRLLRNLQKYALFEYVIVCNQDRIPQARVTLTELGMTIDLEVDVHG